MHHQFLSVILFSVVYCTVIIDDQTFETASTPFYDVSTQSFVVHPFNVTARLIWVDVVEEIGDVEGMIVMVDDNYGIDRFARLFKDAGAVGLVMKVKFLGRGSHFFDRPREPVVFPTLEILEESYDVIKGLLDDGEIVATIVDDPIDDVLFERLYLESLFMNLFLGIFFGIVLVIVSVIFACNIRFVGVQCSFKFTVSIILIGINVIRFLYLIYDPMSRYRLITWKLMGLFYCIHMVMSIASMFVINMFWFEQVNRYSVIKGLDKVKIPYYILIVILIICCIIFAIIAQLDSAYAIVGAYFRVFLAILGVISVMIGIFQLSAAFLINKRISQIEKSFQTKQRIHRYIGKVVIISVIELLFIPPLFYYMLESDDVAITIAITIYWVLCGIESLAVSNLLMIQNPRTSSASKSKKGTMMSMRTQTQQSNEVTVTE